MKSEAVKTSEASASKGQVEPTKPTPEKKATSVPPKSASSTSAVPQAMQIAVEEQVQQLRESSFTGPEMSLQYPWMSRGYHNHNKRRKVDDSWDFTPNRLVTPNEFEYPHKYKPAADANNEYKLPPLQYDDSHQSGTLPSLRNSPTLAPLLPSFFSGAGGSLRLPEPVPSSRLANFYPGNIPL